MAKRKANVMEVALIGAFAAVVLFFGWQIISKIPMNLLGMSTSNTTEYSGKGLWDILQDKLNALKTPTTDWDNRAETAGIIGKLIAEYKKTGKPSLAELKQALITLASKTPPGISDAEAGSCVSSPSSCTTLMTVSDFNWVANVDMNSNYPGGKIPVTLTYTYTYVNDNGDLVSATIVQNAEIQKEQNASHKGSSYSSFLRSYMDAKYNDNLFTGSAKNVQSQINDYLTGKNCELSKDDSQYIDFSGHRVY